MKRLILLLLPVLVTLAAFSGCSDEESQPIITRVVVTPECGVVPVRVDAYGAASGGNETGDPTGGANNLEYTWDFGDGTATTSIAYHLYEEPGEYTVSLTVKDPDGKTASSSVLVSVIPDSMQVEAATTPETGLVGDPMIFDFRAASCAIDPDLEGDYRNLVQEWMVIDTTDGDTLATYLGKSPSHTFSSAGTYDIELKVTYPAWAVTRRDAVTLTVN